MRPTARVIRTDGDGNKRRARRFSTWAAKVIGTIKAVADTLMDRGIIIKMRRATRAEKKTVQRFLMRDTAEFSELRQKCLRWATDEAARLVEADPRLPDVLANRPADNWRSLIAIAIDLLADIRRVFDEDGYEWLGAETLVRPKPPRNRAASSAGAGACRRT